MGKHDQTMTYHSNQALLKLALGAGTFAGALTLTHTVSADTYTVKGGDSLWSIAQSYQTTVANLVAINRIENPDLILVGQQIETAATNTPAPTPTPKPEVPAPVTNPAIRYTVKAGDTLWAISNEQGVSIADIIKYSNIENANLIYVGQELTLKPASTGDTATGSSSTGHTTDPAVSVPLDVYSGPYSTGNTYIAGYCTWYVKDVFKARMGDWWGNAKDWAANARREGVPVDDTPVANLTIAVFQPGSAGADKTYGHVAVVVGVSGDTITVKEMNGTAGFGKVSTRVVPKNAASYIHVDY
jgi:surface antigen